MHRLAHAATEVIMAIRSHGLALTMTLSIMPAQHSDYTVAC
jgi:hypothetical protein